MTKQTKRFHGLQDPKNIADTRALTKSDLIDIKEMISMGYKQKYIAIKYGITPQTLSRYMNGHVKPKD
jgi:DNA invertase Pin-like site-specific DNA recombinase